MSVGIIVQLLCESLCVDHIVLAQVLRKNELCVTFDANECIRIPNFGIIDLLEHLGGFHPHKAPDFIRFQVLDTTPLIRSFIRRLHFSPTRTNRLTIVSW